MSAFFASHTHPQFTPNNHAPLSTEFNRLADLHGWSKKTRTQKRHLCFGEEYAATFNEDESKLLTWQNLCREVGTKESRVPESITQCKLALKKKHVNLIDLMDSRRTGTRPRTHHTAKALAEYTDAQGKIFPKSAAKEDGFIKIFLTKVYAPVHVRGQA